MRRRAPYEDRAHAGRLLARELAAGEAAAGPDALVLGLPRGGVPVAREVARALGAPLDVFLVRKIGVPGREELALGAVASGGVRVLNRRVVAETGVGEAQLAAASARAREELERRERAYRGARPPADPAGRVAILVDDGMATGASLRAAAAALRRLGPARLLAAVPVAPRAARAELAGVLDAFVCPFTPDPFAAVGAWYADFSQTTDAEVRELLEDAFSSGPHG